MACCGKNPADRNERGATERQIQGHYRKGPIKENNPYDHAGNYVGASFPQNEEERVNAVQSSGLIGSEKNEALDRITRLAWARLGTAGTPTVDHVIMRVVSKATQPCSHLSSSGMLLTVLDKEDQYLKSSAGDLLSACTYTPRGSSFCQYALLFDLQEEVLAVDDALKDDRFRDNPLVKGPPYVRAYLGAPVMLYGFILGTLCALDTKSRQCVLPLLPFGRRIRRR